MIFSMLVVLPAAVRASSIKPDASSLNRLQIAPVHENTNDNLTTSERLSRVYHNNKQKNFCKQL